MQPSVLSEASWRSRQETHQARVDGWLTAHLQRRRGGRKHPVEDFLFSYYSYRPAQLRRWHPGAATILAGQSADDLGPGHVDTPAGATLDTAAVLDRRGGSVTWIRDLLARTAGRTPHLGCFGMHEWAMVYAQTQEQLRHHDWPLRLSPEKTAAVVHEIRVTCSHFDAYRFFTPAAKPLNLLTPTRDSQSALEQPGCLHANMDLYKWAYKLVPLVPSELIADCFAFAREIRTVDMRAGPYDLMDLGLEPIRVETRQGRAVYAQRQRDFVESAAVLRQRLISWCDALLAGTQDETRTTTVARPIAQAMISPAAKS